MPPVLARRALLALVAAPLVGFALLSDARLVALPPPALVTAADRDAFRVIAHPGVELSRVERDHLSRLFLKKTTRWPNGVAVLPVDLSEESSVREAFSRLVHQRRTAAIESFWQQMIFSGRAAPPPEMESEPEVVAYVAANPGAVGYVSPQAELAGVTVLQVALEVRQGSPR